MVERLNERDFVDRDGDVRSLADLADDFDAAASLEDLPDDSSPEQPPLTAEQARAFAHGVLFLVDRKASVPSLESTIRQHPSAHNISHAQLDTTVDRLVAAYRAELERLRQQKSKPNLPALQRDTWIAAIRNHLSSDEIAQLQAAIGREEPADEPEPREPDWRERQYKDN